MYCERCNRLAYQRKCPGCGETELRMPRFDDYCFLTEPEPLWVQALCDLLSDNGIEYVTRSIHGAGMISKTGIPQRVRFFVRYRDYQQAKELNEAFFSADFEWDVE